MNTRSYIVYDMVTQHSTQGTQEAVNALKILSNPNRFAIMSLLLTSKNDLCVHEIAERIGISQSLTSHLLAYLEAHGVVEGMRMGQTKCYMPSHTPLLGKVKRIIKSLK
jgi:DNA-binding transcriptional ArsR family regulator